MRAHSSINHLYFRNSVQKKLSSKHTITACAWNRVVSNSPPKKNKTPKIHSVSYWSNRPILSYSLKRTRQAFFDRLDEWKRILVGKSRIPCSLRRDPLRMLNKWVSPKFADSRITKAIYFYRLLREVSSQIKKIIGTLQLRTNRW